MNPPDLELVDSGTAAHCTLTDDLSTSSYSPDESDDDSILILPSPSLHSANKPPSRSSASSIHAGPSLFGKSALDNGPDISQITSWPSTLPMPSPHTAASPISGLNDIQMAASPVQSPTRRLLGVILSVAKHTFSMRHTTLPSTSPKKKEQCMESQSAIQTAITQAKDKP